MESLIQDQHVRNRHRQAGSRRYKMEHHQSFIEAVNTSPSRKKKFTFHDSQQWNGQTRRVSLPTVEVSTKGPSPSPPAFELNGLDLIFVSNLIVVLVILGLYFSRSFGLMGMMINSESLYLPHGLYTELHINTVTERAPDEEVETIEVDHSQFEALEVSDYVIQPGDTLSQIASDHNLNMDTLISFNQIRDVRRMQIGQEFKIPNRDGLLHKVEERDSLASLADEYGSSFNAILDANSLTSETITTGQAIFIPGARMDDTELRLVLGELFIFPTSGRYTSGFGYRPDPFTGERRFHNGVDWANQPGTGIRASMAGTVVHVESQIGNYGKFVIIQHSGGFQTLYAHLETILVHRGEYVSQGETIGRMGNTGRSTGPHLHFSIIRNGVFVDPLAYLH